MRYRVALLIETSNAYAWGLLRGIYSFAREQGAWARFRRYLGHSPHEAIQRVRLRRAEELLTETTLPLAVVADRAGFMHTEYFSVVFKRVTGMSPNQFRQRYTSHSNQSR